jgi:hypothetical protein
MTLLLSFIGIAGSARPETQGSEQANCFVESGADTVVVASMPALETAINAAPPGRNILIAPGTYTGGARTFNRNGTKANPIVVRPQNGLGTVTINGANWTIANTASWLVFSKLHFQGGIITLFGDHNRITRCRFRDNNAWAIRTETVRDCRIDHCDFTTAAQQALHIRPSGFANGTSARLLIDYCYFHDMNPSISTITNFAIVPDATSLPSGETIILDHCLFENINSGDDEIVYFKIGGTVMRFCTFINCADDYIQFRTGAHFEVRSCWFEGMDDMRAWSENNLVIGNRFIGAINCWVPCGNGSWEDQQSGAVGPERYEPATNSKFIGNRFGSGHLQLGGYWPLNNTIPPAFLPASNVLLEANIRDGGGSAHEFIDTFVSPGQINTRVNASSSEPFTPAVKLTAADVGLNAPDPLCG